MLPKTSVADAFHAMKKRYPTINPDRVCCTPRLRSEFLASLALALISAEPLRESGYRLLMEVHEVEGNPAEGLIVFDQLRTVLRNKIGIVPTQQTRALHRRLLGET